MSATVIEWFDPSPSRTYDWFGSSDEVVATVQESGSSFVATAIGPPGQDASDYDPGDLAALFESS
jgi:hypothetical protein